MPPPSVVPVARDWETPGVFGINKREAHVKLRSYAAPAEALRAYTLRDGKETSTRLQPLNGSDWAFQLYAKPEDVPREVLMGMATPSQGWAQVRSEPISCAAPCWALCVCEEGERVCHL